MPRRALTVFATTIFMAIGGAPALASGGEEPTAPAKNCLEADAVLFEQAKLVCLYFGENAENASREGDCPDLAARVRIEDGLAACVFLPPADSPSTGLPSLPSLPPLPGGGLSGLL